jgi:UDP-glucuronate 4-epimerase
VICVVLAAGYATRLYPLTESFPKPLLKIGNKTILDWLLDDIKATGAVRQFVIVSNHRYIEHFRSWAASKPEPFVVLDDGSTGNENRLGAVRDVQIAINALHLDDDLLVVAGDNVLDFSLRHFIAYFKRKQTTCVMRYWEEDRVRLKKAGVAAVTPNDCIRRMEEKPEEPFANWCTPPFYIYKREDLHYVSEALNGGCNADAPGSFIAWLSGQTSVHAMKMPGKRYDIGDIESYQKVQAEYRGVRKYLPMDSEKKYVVTGAARFVGFHLSKSLLEQGASVVGFDNLTDYYDVRLKHARLNILKNYKRFSFIKGDLADKSAVDELFAEKPDIIVHLAAQAGVRYSITNPDVYIQSNIVGFFNILEACRRHPVEHLLYASSSSVYGNQQKTPFSTEDAVSKPISLYAATKKSNELMAYTYNHLYGIPTTGLRFFTVYGPYGRPDMAYYTFTEKLIKGEAIKLFNHGDMKRDFTYIDDIVAGIVNMLANPRGGAKVYNIGNNKPEDLLHFVEVLERCLLHHGLISKPGAKELLPMQQGDVYQTYADIADLEHDFDFKPSTPIEIGLERFVQWYKQYNNE